MGDGAALLVSPAVQSDGEVAEQQWRPHRAWHAASRATLGKLGGFPHDHDSARPKRADNPQTRRRLGPAGSCRPSELRFLQLITRLASHTPPLAPRCPSSTGAALHTPQSSAAAEPLGKRVGPLPLALLDLLKALLRCAGHPGGGEWGRLGRGGWTAPPHGATDGDLGLKRPAAANGVALRRWAMRHPFPCPPSLPTCLTLSITVTGVGAAACACACAWACASAGWATGCATTGWDATTGCATTGWDANTGWDASTGWGA